MIDGQWYPAEVGMRLLGIEPNAIDPTHSYEAVDNLHDEVGEREQEVAILHKALKAAEAKNDDLRSALQAALAIIERHGLDSGLVSEAEAYLDHPSHGGRS